MSAIANGIFKAVAKQYKSIVAARVASVGKCLEIFLFLFVSCSIKLFVSNTHIVVLSIGLKYEDLLIEVSDVEKSLKRIPHDVLIEREQRIKRAFDLSVKRKTLPYENQPANPLDLYLSKELELAQKDREERAILNSY